MPDRPCSTTLEGTEPLVGCSPQIIHMWVTGSGPGIKQDKPGQILFYWKGARESKEEEAGPISNSYERRIDSSPTRNLSGKEVDKVWGPKVLVAALGAEHHSHPLHSVCAKRHTLLPSLTSRIPIKSSTHIWGTLGEEAGGRGVQDQARTIKWSQ